MVKDPIFRYIDFRNNFNEAGNMFIRRKQPATAIQLLQNEYQALSKFRARLVWLREAYSAASQKRQSMCGLIKKQYTWILQAIPEWKQKRK